MQEKKGREEFVDCINGFKQPNTLDISSISAAFPSQAWLYANAPEMENIALNPNAAFVFRVQCSGKTCVILIQLVGVLGSVIQASKATAKAVCDDTVTIDDVFFALSNMNAVGLKSGWMMKLSSSSVLCMNQALCFTSRSVGSFWNKFMALETRSIMACAEA